MTDEEFGVIKTELERLGRGLTEAVRQIIYQEAEITALRWIMEQHGVAIAGELDIARDEAILQLNAPLERISAGGVDEVPRRVHRRRERWRM
jgi:hypothetical protein